MREKFSGCSRARAIDVYPGSLWRLVAFGKSQVTIQCGNWQWLEPGRAEVLEVCEAFEGVSFDGRKVGNSI